MSWVQVRKFSPAWLWKRVCRYIPERSFLFTIVKEFFDNWGPVKCSVTDQPLFSAESWKKAQSVLHDIRKGWISDPSGIPLYMIKGLIKMGLHSIIAFEEQIQLKVLYTIPFDIVLHH
jgi:hypothetical protein